MEKEIKPVKAYCIWSPWQGLLAYTTSEQAKQAKEAFSTNLFERPWANFHKEGFRCVRVEIKKLEQEPRK